MGHATSAATAADTPAKNRQQSFIFHITNRHAPTIVLCLEAVWSPCRANKLQAQPLPKHRHGGPAFGPGEMMGAAGQTACATRNRGEAAPTQPPALAAPDV